MWHLNKGDVQNLNSARTPHVYLFRGEDGDLEKELQKHGLADHFLLEGKQMASLDELYDEFSAKLHFPDYFGRNLDALWDCLTDLGWLDKERILIVVRDVGHLAKHESILSILIEYFKDAAIQWAIPIDPREQQWSHGSVPFNVIFQVEGEQEYKELAEKLDEFAGKSYWSTLNSAWNN